MRGCSVGSPGQRRGALLWLVSLGVTSALSSAASPCSPVDSVSATLQPSAQAGEVEVELSFVGHVQIKCILRGLLVTVGLSNQALAGCSHQRLGSGHLCLLPHNGVQCKHPKRMWLPDSASGLKLAAAFDAPADNTASTLMIKSQSFVWELSQQSLPTSHIASYDQFNALKPCTPGQLPACAPVPASSDPAVPVPEGIPISVQPERVQLLAKSGGTLHLQVGHVALRARSRSAPAMRAIIDAEPFRRT